MTVETIETVVELIEEIKGTSNPVNTVWEYTNAYANKVMYAVFTFACYNDIWESPAVLNPKCIYYMGRFRGDYEYLNG